MRPSRIAPLAVLLVTALALPATAHHKSGHPIPPGHQKKRPAPVPTPVDPPCTGRPDDVKRLDLRVAGQPAWGLFALPEGRPKGLVAYMHGYTHTAESWRHHIAETARKHGVIAVAMNYRNQVDSPPAAGGLLPSSRGWRVAEGAEDTVAAARYFESICKVKTIVAYGVSMGGNTAGLAVASKATRRDKRTPLFDWWVQIEGASNLVETYHEAKLVAQSGNAYAANAAADIEAAMGGTFVEKRDVYLQRTVVNRIADIKASGVKGVIVVHGVMDGTVPYDQSAELVAGLRAASVPTDFYSVLTRGTAEPGTTIDSYVLAHVPGAPQSSFAGHASETSTTHLVMKTGFDRLTQLFAGTLPKCRNVLVDGTLDPVSPHPVTTGPTC